MNKPLYQQILNGIVEDIRNGNLMPGDKVPSEKELSERFHVSRITAKKALDVLASNNSIVRVRGKGSYVTERLLNREEQEADENHPSILDYQGLLIGALFPHYWTGYGLKLQHAIEKKVSELNGTLIIKRGCGNIEEEEKAIASLIHLGVKGLIAFPVNSEQYNRKLLKLILDGFPTVIVDRDLKGILASTVSTDNKAAAQELTTLLFEKGHKQIAFLSPPPELTSTVDDRLQGFQQAFLQHGIRLRSEHLITNLKSTILAGSEASQHDALVEQDTGMIKEFVSANPEVTSFVVVEYELAIMLTKILTQLNKRVPDDYSIVCFDCPDDPFDIPRFTHIRQDEVGMGEKAVELLMGKLQGDGVPLQTLLDFKLIEGQSTRSLST
ncbi:GntR family transcriptional regulator [Paenibacillus herberti]|uniref:GntR family transcriptional regulator n=1 Tax=Paenibacillus herberti TaxID=1619309 RepID=A0A229P142_9BACL|nr:LacI family DNA-binding transcriptional regulator [Paenibacillus herberti]OXM15654.1 GntR family transcriptional regulator [Paenibacillus herberti]